MDYRLAPEHPFPAAWNDGKEAISWVLQHASQYNIDTRRIGLWGISAGANIAASLAADDAASAGPPKICHVNLVVPAVSPPEFAADYLKKDQVWSMDLFPVEGPTDGKYAAVRRMWCK